MDIRSSKTYVALVAAGAIAGFVAVVATMPSSRGLLTSALARAYHAVTRTAAPTAAEARTACREDARRLCAGVTAGADRVRCLMERGDNLSPACRSAIADRHMHRADRPVAMENSPQGNMRARINGEPRAAPHSACASDLQQYCAGVERGGGRIIRCLGERSADLSSACRSFMQQIVAHRDGRLRRHAQPSAGIHAIPGGPSVRVE